MKYRKANPTPIIVGVVIALLGVLGGLYIAQNAREQAQLNAASDMPAETLQTPAPTPTEMPLPETPLEPVVVDEPTVAETDVDKALPPVEEMENVTDVETPVPDVQQTAEASADTPTVAETPTLEQTEEAKNAADPTPTEEQPTTPQTVQPADSL
jgi:hypothetical protein